MLAALPPREAAAQAQITTGVIEGTITDASGGVVPGASVEARNLDTNQARARTTDAAGRFVFLQLPPGRYTVTVSLAGFATIVQEGVTLTVGQTVTLNQVMKPSTVAETVTVTGTSTVDVSRTQSSSTLDETTIATTPILGRKFEDLLTLTPGVSIVQGPDGDEITFSGQRGVFNNISLDGGDYNNGFFGEQMGGQRAAIDITLEAVKEFQVVDSGANAEFGRTAGGVVNVITKSGTNELHGSLFHYQRLEALTSEASDGSKLEDFHREQFGGTLGGPLKKDKAFFFIAAEHINEGFQRANLSAPLGSCPVGSPNIAAHEALIAGNAECQRLALLDFFRTSRGQDEGQPIDHTIDNTALLAKLDWMLNPSHQLAISWNFDRSENVNQTFDVPGYGNSANGIEGPSKINVVNLNLFSTLSPTRLNEFHVTYSRELRPRSAVESNVPADTAMGFANTFRFGNPFFLQPNVDELIWRAQIKNNFSLVLGRHTVKMGAEWVHTLNDQTFRGFFSGRYIFDSATGFLRYAAPAGPGGFGPNAVACSDGTWVTFPASCPAGTSVAGTPLLLYIQESGSGLPGVPAPGSSRITNDEFSLFVQDTWKPDAKWTVNYGLRWDAQFMPETVDPASTAYAQFIGDPRFPSDGTIPDQLKQIQPRLGVAWDVGGDGRSVVRASAGLFYARQNMLSQVGSVTANGLQQQTVVRGLFTGLVPGVLPMPVWPNILPVDPVPAGQFPLFTGVRVFDKDYQNPRIIQANLAYERELARDWSGYVDLTWAQGRHLTRFINVNRGDRGAPFSPALGDVFVASSIGKSEYLGGTVGLRKRFSRGFQMEANYVLASDKDDDSNERDPFTDRSFDPFDFSKDYGYSDRDIRHKLNLYGYGEFAGFRGNVRVQARSAQPITPDPRVVNGVDLGRNTARKDNKFFSLDWRLSRPFKLGQRAELIPTIEMFNTLNNTNNINTVSTPPLLDFSGFLRLGVGDPRQVQLSAKLTF
ncbi:MAG TPA: TonB-dependent receptor [Vicinamibacteria bacterium]|nr:TonB-dependent receptor [Vicinamibacteria bacterium]